MACTELLLPTIHIECDYFPAYCHTRGNEAQAGQVLALSMGLGAASEDGHWPRAS